ncbi:hypothetical protein [Pseudoduganella chitinolytica]|uniref:LysM domain-containing protein n=1 Tax=Pseudoduganella chitinolytica TaxID=34070 RepID=A0ABY8BAE2_9BURK|nr:hypothetical protein [Pseudoduganella chitinolytica]WEF32877.1 hypothetical protein PX653_26365 [Pseudoduganella chitinolytica]
MSRWESRAADRGQTVADIIDYYSKGTDGGMAEAVLRERFNAQVSEAMATLQATTLQHAAATARAVKRLKEIVNTDNVARHTQEVVLGNAVRAGGKPAFQGNQLTLDRWGNVLSITDPRDPNWKLSYTYNGANQQTSGTALGAKGSQTALQTSRYDALGRLVGTVDGRGALTQYVYDTAGNLAREIHADDGVVTNTYDAFGNRLSTTQPDTVLANGEVLTGVTTRYSYDHLGHLLSTRTAAVDVYLAIDTGFGPLPSNLVAHKELVQTRKYDELGRLVRSLGSNDTGTEQEYDGSGNVISTATATFDKNGVRALYGRTLIAYDAENHKIASRDANGKSLSWQYKNGRLHTSKDMSNRTTWYGYDAAGHQRSQTSERGQKLYYTYSGDNLVRIDDRATSLSTVYAYDSAGNRVGERQVYLGKPQDAPTRLQNNTLTVDNLNRITRVQDDLVTLDYEYDANGNRVKIVSRYGNADPITKFNAFDAMNRQTIVNGNWEVDAQGRGKAVRGTGHEITYDRSGNRLSDTYSGTRVINNFISYGTEKDAETTETYRYDAAGRLQSIRRDGLLIDERHYDDAGRISQSGLAAKGARGVADVLKALGIDIAQRVYTYNVFGHMTRQKDLNASLDGMQDIWFNGYDEMGNLTGYDVVSAADGKNKGIYRIEYDYRDAYKELKTTLAKDGSVVTSTYDANGNRISILETKTDKTTVRNRLWYDADGHVQSYKPEGKDGGFNLIVNGNVLGEEDGDKDNLLGSNYLPVTSPSMVAAPSSYSVQSANETLQSIAQSVWGDANLWYLIADANALTAESALKVGDILRIPARVNTVHGDYDTYKPYDPSEQIGNTAPVMPPPKAKGCGVLGQVIMVVIAVAVTAMAAVVLGPLLGTSIAGQLGTLALSGAAGSIASQGAGMAMDMQDKFSWKSVGRAALSNVMGGAAMDPTSWERWLGQRLPMPLPKRYRSLSDSRMGSSGAMWRLRLSGLGSETLSRSTSAEATQWPNSSRAAR